MKQIVKTLILLFLSIAAYFTGWGQEYQYSCDIEGVNDQWQKIILPNAIFGKVNDNLSDIRIYGIRENKDTIEIPYLLKQLSAKTESEEISFEQINTAYSQKGYFYTFEIPVKHSINQIKLDFTEKNFDWKIELEGSQDQKVWFTLLDNYRIVSVKNELTDYQFTRLKFPDANYRFFRLTVLSEKNPGLKAARISEQKITDGIYRTYKVSGQTVQENKKTKATEIDVVLESPVPVSQIKIGIADTLDYYRPVIVQYLSDSTKTDKGWNYYYRTLSSGTLSSIEKNSFSFESTIANKLKIIVHNNDNQPLHYGEVEVSGTVYELIARFDEPARYVLSYGNKNVFRPSYDINYFSNKIPEGLKAVTLENCRENQQVKISKENTLFNNKNWLWGIMLIIIFLLSWFTLKMIRKS